MPKPKQPMFIYRPRSKADGTPGDHDGELVIDIAFRETRRGRDYNEAYALLANRPHGPTQRRMPRAH